ncbi:hypothetical protein LTR37_000733 [Vermiconidia calcicola]|uniref:Uncharacterized protein n=1 Tax=Vermiconidia calcicola TaxID=1690605 RepID=A0ACC3NZ01_9PEZI|nr:hypothetical protein LTR37_000733 [Vermiconidia calcicola]
MAAALIDPRANDNEGISISDTPVKIVVGSDGEGVSFYVHPAILQKHSSFFEAALKKEWTSGPQRIVDLRDEDPGRFTLYAQWLYTGKLFTKLEPAMGGYKRHAQLYVLGEKLIDRTFLNRVMDAIISARREPGEDGKKYHPNASLSSIVYSGTPKCSPLRRFMVDCYARSGSNKSIQLHADEPAKVDHGFLMDLSAALLANRSASKNHLEEKYSHLERGIPCAYHIHEGGDLCEGATPGRGTEDGSEDKD